MLLLVWCVFTAVRKINTLCFRVSAVASASPSAHMPHLIAALLYISLLSLHLLMSPITSVLKPYRVQQKRHQTRSSWLLFSRVSMQKEKAMEHQPECNSLYLASNQNSPLWTERYESQRLTRTAPEQCLLHVRGTLHTWTQGTLAVCTWSAQKWNQPPF